VGTAGRQRGNLPGRAEGRIRKMWLLRTVFSIIIIAYSWAAFKSYKKQDNPIGYCVIAAIFAGIWLLTELII